jgi:hypothetical protein
MNDVEAWLTSVQALLGSWSSEPDEEAALDRLLVLGLNLELPQRWTSASGTLLQDVVADLRHLASATSDELADVRRQRAELIRSAHAMRHYVQSLNIDDVVPILP